MNAFRRLPRGGRLPAVILSAVFLACPGCMPRAPLPEMPSPQPSVSAAVSSPPEAAGSVPDAIPGTGILSHEYEERDVSPRMSRVASVPAISPAPPVSRTEHSEGTLRAIRTPTALRDEAPGKREIVLPGLDDAADVYALSPFARLLARPDRPYKPPVRRPAEVPVSAEGKNGGYSGHFVPPGAARPAPAEWEALAREAEEIFGLDAGLVLAVIRAESAFNHVAESPVGAQGAMQVMPGTQEELGLIDPFDPRANVYAGSQYLMELMRRFGSVELALAAYNAGPASVEKYGGIPPFPETRDFVRRVMTYWAAGKRR